MSSNTIEQIVDIRKTINKRWLQKLSKVDALPDAQLLPARL